MSGHSCKGRPSVALSHTHLLFFWARNREKKGLLSTSSWRQLLFLFRWADLFSTIREIAKLFCVLVLQGMMMVKTDDDGCLLVKFMQNGFQSGHNNNLV